MNFVRHDQNNPLSMVNERKLVSVLEPTHIEAGMTSFSGNVEIDNVQVFHTADMPFQGQTHILKLRIGFRARSEDMPISRRPFAPGLLEPLSGFFHCRRFKPLGLAIPAYARDWKEKAVPRRRFDLQSTAAKKTERREDST